MTQVVAEPKTIQVEPGSEMDQILQHVDSGSVVLVHRGMRYRLVLEPVTDHIWADYDVDALLGGTLETAGKWKDFDAEAFKAYIRERRRISSRPQVEL